MKSYDGYCWIKSKHSLRTEQQALGVTPLGTPAKFGQGSALSSIQYARNISHHPSFFGWKILVALTVWSDSSLLSWSFSPSPVHPSSTLF